MNWKKEIKGWGMMWAVIAILYVTGLMAPIMGGIQSLILATGMVKPNTEKSTVETPFNYQGRFTDMNGGILHLEEFKGKTLFINLWATWCPPCRAEMPHISELYKKVNEVENLEFLIIALDDDFDKSKKLVKDKNFSFPIMHAAFGLNNSLQSQSIPTTLVIGPTGEILFYQEGMSNFDTEEFRDFLVNASEK